MTKATLTGVRARVARPCSRPAPHAGSWTGAGPAAITGCARRTSSLTGDWAREGVHTSAWVSKRPMRPIGRSIDASSWLQPTRSAILPCGAAKLRSEGSTRCSTREQRARGPQRSPFDRTATERPFEEPLSACSLGAPALGLRRTYGTVRRKDGKQTGTCGATADTEAGGGPSRRQEEVLDAVLDLLAEGRGALTMSAVAQRASCSKETLYKWFRRSRTGY